MTLIAGTFIAGTFIAGTLIAMTLIAGTLSAKKELRNQKQLRLNVESILKINHRLREKNMTKQTLNEKRKELIFKIKQDCWADFQTVYNAIEKQEKEAVKRLKDEIHNQFEVKEDDVSEYDLYPIIEAIFGKELTE
jgi:uncharacterized coiled-coil DUF342 family protein